MSADTAIDAVVTAIEQDAKRAGTGGRITELAAALDSLVRLRETDRRAPSEPERTEGEPQIIKPLDGVVEWLRAQPLDTPLQSQRDQSYWQRGDHGLWYTIGSSTGFTSDDLAARGPFDRLALP